MIVLVIALIIWVIASVWWSVYNLCGVGQRKGFIRASFEIFMSTPALMLMVCIGLFTSIFLSKHR
jgi:hypothetical protein